MECIICTNVQPQTAFISPSGGCEHLSCITCVRHHAKAYLHHGGLDIKCIYSDCDGNYGTNQLNMILSPSDLEILTTRQTEAAIPPSLRVYCPFKECSVLMEKSCADMEMVECMACHRGFCAKCNNPWHDNMTCDENANQSDDKEFHDLAKTRLWKACHECRQMVELVEGCYHIVCRCGNQFCYNCGSKWFSEGPEGYLVEHEECDEDAAVMAFHQVVDPHGLEAYYQGLHLHDMLQMEQVVHNMPHILPNMRRRVFPMMAPNHHIVVGGDVQNVQQYGQYMQQYGQYMQQYGQYMQQYGQYMQQYGQYMQHGVGIIQNEVPNIPQEVQFMPQEFRNMTPGMFNVMNLYPMMAPHHLQVPPHEQNVLHYTQNMQHGVPNMQHGVGIIQNEVPNMMRMFPRMAPHFNPFPRR